MSTEYYETKDWNEVVYLITCGYQPVEIRRCSPGSVEFIFENWDECVDRLIELEWQSTDAAAVAHKMFDSMREARDLVQRTL